MKKQYLLLFLLFLSQAFQAQSYLRVVDPNRWWARNTDFSQWAYNTDEGIFESVSIVLTPLGVYTEVEVFATIADPGVPTWGNNLEIIWQFELPSNAIVHDSWLWVENDIIRADIVDYWTALNTYEEIVNRNQDPSFLFIKPDNRYELRVFPLPINTSRRVKMSFLVPSDWSRSTVTQSVLQSIFQSTSLFNSDIQLAVATNPTWGVPILQLGATTLPMNQLATGADGRTFHLLPLDPYAFTEAEEVHVSWDAPFDDSSNTFLRTYQQDGEQFYQLAFAPDWEAALPGNNNRVSGITDYNVSLQNGICYQRYNLSSPTNNHVLLQVGKMAGLPPFEVSGIMLTDDNQLIRTEASLPSTAIVTGDTLMQEIWYGQYLKGLFQQVSSDADRLAVIEISKRQRILTPLTAFIALEPSQGGVPCDECINSDEIFIATEEPYSPTKLTATVTPNPASTMAHIAVALTEDISEQGWQAVVLDAAGRVVARLELVSSDKGTLVWEWVIPEHQPAGMYVCKLTNNQTSIVTKIMVVK